MLYTGAGVGLLIGALLIVGYVLPVAHVASAEARFVRSPAEVFATIADVKRYPEWRPDVSRVELLAEAPRTRWKESGSNGEITFEVEDATPPGLLRARIADRTLPFGGTWTYEVTPSGSGTRVRITEHGEVYNPVFRFVSRFVFGHTATIDRFLKNLEAHLTRRAGQ
jgi:uncharacterized protein YndB with AHSA1/START domain